MRELPAIHPRRHSRENHSFLQTPQTRLLHYDGRPEIGDIRQIILENNFNPDQFGNQSLFDFFCERKKDVFLGVFGELCRQLQRF